MKKIKKIPLPIQIVIGLFIGIILGLILEGKPETASTYIKPIGVIFLNLIKLVIVPLVFSSLVVGVSELKDIKKLGKIGLKTFCYYMITTVFAITLGLIFSNLFEPGRGYNLPATLSDIKVMSNFLHQIIHLAIGRPDLNRRIQQPGRANQLLGWLWRMS